MYIVIVEGMNYKVQSFMHVYIITIYIYKQTLVKMF